MQFPGQEDCGRNEILVAAGMLDAEIQLRARWLCSDNEASSGALCM